MFAIGAFIKDGLPFIDGSQLDSVVADFGMVALGTWLFNGRANGFLDLSQRSLFGVALGPNRCRSLHGIRCYNGFILVLLFPAAATTTTGIVGRSNQFIQRRVILANVAADVARPIDLQSHVTNGTKWPRHDATLVRETALTPMSTPCSGFVTTAKKEQSESDRWFMMERSF